MSLLDIQAEKVLDRMTPVQKGGMSASRAIHKAILSTSFTRKIADFLHGTWLGHPLHPVMTDFTIGAWTMASIFDAAGAIADNPELRRTGDHLTTAGTISAVPTAITGIVEYSTAPEAATTTATLHGALNAAIVGVYVGSIAARRRGDHARGAALGALGLGMTMVSAWLGGKLVYTYKVGVDHSDHFEKPKRWTEVLDARSLPMNTPKRVDFDGKPVLLYRDQNGVYALGAACPHAGGPLDEGKFSDGCVECPWHQSVFDMSNGQIVHGPTTRPAPAFEARINNGKVQIRLCQNRACTSGNPEGHQFA